MTTQELLRIMEKQRLQRDLQVARELLDWSRTLEQHGLTFEAWKLINSSTPTNPPPLSHSRKGI